MDIDHEGGMIGAIFERVPTFGGDDHNRAASNHLPFTINDHFDIAVENDKDFFIGVTMFVRALTRQAVHDEKRCVRTIVDALKLGRSASGWSKAGNLDDLHSDIRAYID